VAPARGKTFPVSDSIGVGFKFGSEASSSLNGRQQEQALPMLICGVQDSDRLEGPGRTGGSDGGSVGEKVWVGDEVEHCAEFIRLPVPEPESLRTSTDP
jgi:hypothetical protein